MAKRAKYLTLGQYCQLIKTQVDEINAAIDTRLPVTSLDSIYGCAITWDSGYMCYTIHHKRKYSF